MDIKTIESRLLNAEAKKVKVEGIIIKCDKALVKMEGDLNKKYDYSSKLNQKNDNVKKLVEIEKDIIKYTNLLAVEKQRREDAERLIPQILKDKLEEYKQQCKKYFIELSNKYIELYNKEYELTRNNIELIKTTKHVKSGKGYESIKVNKYSESEIEEILNGEYFRIENVKSNIKHYYITEFKNGLNASDLYIIDKIVQYKEEIDLDTLEDILNKDIEERKIIFLERVSAKVGVVKEFKYFEIGINGEINGIAVGDKAKAKIITILAGGYNIQIEHMRVLVKVIK